MARVSTLTFDRGTLILHPPPKGSEWAQFVQWDERIEKFRLPAHQYRNFLEAMRKGGIDIKDDARHFQELQLPTPEIQPFLHQQQALHAWKQAGRRGVVVLPTGSGKTILAQLVMHSTPRSTLICVPTLDLMHQWYAGLLKTFPGAQVGLLGGGSKDDTPILVSTYDSAAIHAERLGNQYALHIYDECHHLPTDFYQVISDYSIAPYRLGLTATLERTDGGHDRLTHLIGPTVFKRTPEQLSGGVLSPFKEVQIKVSLSPEERQEYDRLIEERNRFLKDQNINLSSLQGWQQFVKQSARSQAGRGAMLAHRSAREIAFGTSGKLRVLSDLLSKHLGERTVIFTDDNATVYKISEQFLIPAITHQTPVKERHATLERFRSGDYPVIVTSRVLNEGVDVPEASIGMVLSGTATQREYIQRLGRILRRKEGKEAILYEVISEGTSEERVSERRRGVEEPKKPPTPIKGLEQGTLDLNTSVSWEDL